MLEWKCIPHGTRFKVDPWHIHPIVLKAVHDAHPGHTITAYYETHLHGYWGGEERGYVELPDAPGSFGRVEVDCETCSMKSKIGMK